MQARCFGTSTPPRCSWTARWSHGNASLENIACPYCARTMSWWPHSTTVGSCPTWWLAMMLREHHFEGFEASFGCFSMTFRWRFRGQLTEDGFQYIPHYNLTQRAYSERFAARTRQGLRRLKGTVYSHACYDAWRYLICVVCRHPSPPWYAGLGPSIRLRKTTSRDPLLALFPHLQLYIAIANTCIYVCSQCATADFTSLVLMLAMFLTLMKRPDPRLCPLGAPPLGDGGLLGLEGVWQIPGRGLDELPVGRGSLRQLRLWILGHYISRSWPLRGCNGSASLLEAFLL